MGRCSASVCPRPKNRLKKWRDSWWETYGHVKRQLAKPSPRPSPFPKGRGRIVFQVQSKCHRLKCRRALSRSKNGQPASLSPAEGERTGVRGPLRRIRFLARKYLPTPPAPSSTSATAA